MPILGNTRFMYPITPSGRTSLLEIATNPTHRIAGDSLIIGFEADPAVVREFVPEPLELDGSGLIYLWTYDGWFYADSYATEEVAMERMNFTESFFWIPCDYRGERYHYMLFSWTTRDWLAYLGRAIGQPHKIGKVQMTRFHPAERVYHGPGPDVRVTVNVECVGEVLRAHCDLERRVDPGETPFRISDDYCPRFLGHRFFWDACEDRPAVNDLVCHWGDAMTLGEIWSGPADLRFLAAENEEVLPFQPRRVLGGWWFTLRFDHKQSTPYVVHRFED